ncbi:MAG: PAS domain-containing methyl-accepting chemotaxis protein [Pseudomonadota bacterium]
MTLSSLRRLTQGGVITYANDAFVEISGYSRGELIGQHHNIVRHRDMPKWAFADLWQTVKSGHPWRGIVKNRTKSGTYYWVLATVSPVISNNQIVGYMSLRRKPTREEVVQAEALYRLPEIHSSLLMILMQRLQSLTLKAKLHLTVQGVMLVILVVVCLFMSSAMKTIMVEDAQNRASAVANQVIDSANMLMLTGSINSVEDRRLMISKIIAGSHIQSLRLMRTDQVVKQYGNGLPEEKIESELHQQVVSSKQPYYALEWTNGKPQFHAVTPYLATSQFHGTNCLSCHQVNEGSVNGLSDVTIDLTDDFANYYHVLFQLITLVLMIQAALYLLIQLAIKRFVASPVNKISDSLNQLVNGDVRGQIDISRRDELGKVMCALQTCMVYLGSCFDRITTVSRKLHQANQLSVSVASIANATQAQSEAASNIAAAVEEMTVSVDQIAENFSEVRRISEHSRNAANNGEIAVKKVVTEMSRINVAVNEAAEKVDLLGVKTGQITGIVKTIREIADQTNLLALNAAIEAARAGESGRGFAVVADEVRQLAGKTSAATKDISIVVGEIGLGTTVAVSKMKLTVDMVNEGTLLAEKTGNAMEEINAGTLNVLRGVEDTMTTLQEQRAASREIAINVERVAQMSEQNSLALKSVSSTAECLRDQVIELDRSIEQFKI